MALNKDNQKHVEKAVVAKGNQAESAAKTDKKIRKSIDEPVSKSAFVDIGFSNYIEISRILTISHPNSSPMKRLSKTMKEAHRFIDLTEGKKTRSLITQQTENGLMITGSYVAPSTIVARINKALFPIRGKFDQEAVVVKENDIIKEKEFLDAIEVAVKEDGDSVIVNAIQ